MGKKSKAVDVQRERQKTIVLLLAVVAAAAFVLLINFVVDWLWFKEMGYVSVFLTQLKTELLPEGGIPEDAKIDWVEKVEIMNEFVESTEILTQEDAIAVLKSTTETTQSYTIQSGDALYLIANEFKTTVEKLLELNPGSDLNKSIKVGQVINVPVQKPKISIKTIETQVLTAVEPKQYQTQFDDTKPSSYQKVIQQGKAGQKKSTIQITRVNGVVIEEKEVSKEIIQEAVPEIIVKGTQ